MEENNSRREFLRAAGIASGSLALTDVAAAQGDDHLGEDVRHPGPGRFDVDVHRRDSSTVLVTVHDHETGDVYNYVTNVQNDAIQPKEVDVEDHENLVQKYGGDSDIGIQNHGGMFPDAPDFVERWDHFNVKTSNGCGSMYGDHYMVGVTFETEEPVSSYAGPALGAMIGGALGSIIPLGGTAVGSAMGGLIGGLVGAILGQGYETHYLTVAFADHDTGPWWATVPLFTSQHSGDWNDQQANHMYVNGTSPPGVHLSPIASEF